MRTLPAELSALARTQEGVLLQRQLSDAGFRTRDVERRVAAGLWQRVSSRTVVVHSLQVQRISRLWASALHHERVGLTGAAALEISGLPASRDGRIDLLAPHGERQSPFDGCRLITSLREPFLITTDGPPRTDIPVSVAMAMACASSLRQAVFYCTWAVQRRLVSLDEIRAALTEQPKSARMAAARRVLDTVDPGVHSVNEYDFARACAKRHLPNPVRQVPRRDSRGRMRYTDVEFHVGSQSVVVEIDGLGHLESSVSVDDQWRANELTLQDSTVIRVPAIAIRVSPEPFFEQLRRALQKAAVAQRG